MREQIITHVTFALRAAGSPALSEQDVPLQTRSSLRGEASPPSAATSISCVPKRRRMINLYGPTEATI